MSSRKILLLSPLLILCSQIVYAASLYTCPQPSELISGSTWQCPDGFKCYPLVKSPANIVVAFTAAGINTQGVQCNYGNSEGNVIIVGMASSDLLPVNQSNWFPPKDAGGTWVSKPNTTITDLAWEYKP